MQFEISHEFDFPLDALELALMSPDLGREMAERVKAVEAITAVRHEVTEKTFERVWHFQAKAPLKVLSGYDITRDMMTWEEHASYERSAHRGEWHVVPRPGVDVDANWRKHFNAQGNFQLNPLADGRSRRIVSGLFNIEIKLVGRVVERVAVAELRKAYQAEADALTALCSLL